MEIVKLLAIIPELLPGIAETVKEVEAIMPPGTPGAAKLEAARGVIEGVYVVSKEVNIAFDDVWPIIQRVIAGVVTAYNAAGLFAKPAPEAVAVAVAQ